MQRVMHKYQIGANAPAFDVRIGYDDKDQIWEATIGYVGTKGFDPIEQIQMFSLSNIKRWVLDMTVVGSSVFTITDMESNKHTLCNLIAYDTNFATTDGDLGLYYYTAVDHDGTELRTRPRTTAREAMIDLMWWIFNTHGSWITAGSWLLVCRCAGHQEPPGATSRPPGATSRLVAPGGSWWPARHTHRITNTHEHTAGSGSTDPACSVVRTRHTVTINGSSRRTVTISGDRRGSRIAYIYCIGRIPKLESGRFY